MTQVKSYIEMDKEELIQVAFDLKDENLNLRKSLDMKEKMIETLCGIIDQLKTLSLRLKKSADQVLTSVEGTPNLTGTCAQHPAHTEVTHGTL